LPGAPGLLATMIRAAHQHRRERDTSVGVSRPRDLTACTVPFVHARSSTLRHDAATASPPHVS
ncbi:MAG: hypothetical protein E6471_02265, partial [Bradyrhizobium sp.]|nr:hypothetical protein [Bradyrhizobium sp.]